jgi:hypothetical protein
MAVEGKEYLKNFEKDDDVSVIHQLKLDISGFTACEHRNRNCCSITDYFLDI